MNKKNPLVNKHIRLGSEKLGSEKMLPNAADKKILVNKHTKQRQR